MHRPRREVLVFSGNVVANQGYFGVSGRLNRRYAVVQIFVIGTGSSFLPTAFLAFLESPDNSIIAGLPPRGTSIFIGESPVPGLTLPDGVTPIRIDLYHVLSGEGVYLKVQNRMGAAFSAAIVMVLEEVDEDDLAEPSESFGA